MEQNIFKQYEIDMLIEIVDDQINNIKDGSISYGDKELNEEWLNDWKVLKDKLNSINNGSIG